MNTQQITPEHLSQFSRSQHVLEWLQSEKDRIQAEMVTVAQQWQREEAKLRSLLSQHYGIVGPFTLDAEAGTVSTPGDAPSAEQ
jgi:hypothetical protein